MCRVCIGYVSGIYRKIRGGKNEKKMRFFSVGGLLNVLFFLPFYLHFYVHYPECYSGTHVYAILCQSPDFALKNPVYILKIVAKIIRKVIFCQNETLICEYRTSFS